MKNRKLITIFLFGTFVLIFLIVMFRVPMESSKKGSQPPPERPADFGQTVMNVTTSSGSFVSLAWTASTDPTITGYKLNYGTGSGNYSQHLDVGMTTTATAVNLMPGTTYFFAANSYNAGGGQSGFSNEIAYSVPTGPTQTPGQPTPNPTPSPVPSASPPRTPSPTPPPAGSTGITFWADVIPEVTLSNDTLNFVGRPNVQPTPQRVRVKTSNLATWGSNDTLTWLDAGNVTGQQSGKFLTVKPNTGLGVGTYTGDIAISASGLPTKQLHVRLVVSNATPAPSATPVRTPTPAPTASPSPSATVAPTASPAPSPAPSSSPSVTPSPSVSPSPAPTSSPCVRPTPPCPCSSG